MAFNDKITTSLRGRRLGLQTISSGISGGSRGPQEYLVGPEALRANVSTAPSTSVNLHPFGIALLPVSTAGSSQVYTIDPPIPGVRKTITVNTTTASVYLKTANSETFLTTAGSSHTTIKIIQGGSFEMVGLTTAIWAMIGVTTGTSLTTGGFSLTTST